MAIDISQQNISKDLGLLESKLNQLKLAYDRYFRGQERLQPTKLNNDVVALVRKYSGTPIQNTALKFRYEQLVARFNSFQTFWGRTLREIEDGSYKGEQFKKMLEGRDEGEPPDSADTKGKPAKSAGIQLKVKDPVSILYEKYIEARTRNKESVAGVTVESLRKVISKQTATIKQRFACKKVVFKVVTEKGKVRIKALPKK